MKKTLIFAALLAVLFVGCGKGDEIANKLGDKIGDAITASAKKIEEANAEQNKAVSAELSQTLQYEGLTLTTSTLGKEKTVSLYLTAKKEFKGTLLAKAMNKEGNEIGRATADVEFAVDDAKYVNFKFPTEMDTQLAEKYTVDKK